MSNSLQPHGLQHARLPYPSPTQTHIYWVSDSIQPFHPLSPPSPLAHNLSQCQGLFQWVNSSHQVTKVLEFQISLSLKNLIPFYWLPPRRLRKQLSVPSKQLPTVHLLPRVKNVTVKKKNVTGMTCVISFSYVLSLSLYYYSVFGVNVFIQSYLTKVSIWNPHF